MITMVQSYKNKIDTHQPTSKQDIMRSNVEDNMFVNFCDLLNHSIGEVNQTLGSLWRMDDWPKLIWRAVSYHLLYIASYPEQ